MLLLEEARLKNYFTYLGFYSTVAVLISALALCFWKIAGWEYGLPVSALIYVVIGICAGFLCARYTGAFGLGEFTLESMTFYVVFAPIAALIESSVVPYNNYLVVLSTLLTLGAIVFLGALLAAALVGAGIGLVSKRTRPAG